MLTEVIDQATKLKQKTTTYNTGILQSKAYRILKSETAQVLSRHDITPLDWALLGKLFDHPDGLSLTILADFLDVEPPLITRRVSILERGGLLAKGPDQTDQRAKRVALTTKGAKIVSTVEPKLKKAMKPLVAGVSRRDLVGYFRVLSAIVASRTSNDD